AAPAAREPWTSATPAALACWPAARRASRTRSRRCSRLSLMVVRIYLCHSKPSGLFRLPNMAVLPKAVVTRNDGPHRRRGAGMAPKAAGELGRTGDGERGDAERGDAEMGDAERGTP